MESGGIFVFVGLGGLELCDMWPPIEPPIVPPIEPKASITNKCSPIEPKA